MVQNEPQDSPGGAIGGTHTIETGRLSERINRGRPRHFHLLWDDELQELQPVLNAIVDRMDEVITNWYQLYVLHFGDQRTLTDHEFREIFHTALTRNSRDLLAGDMDTYALDTSRTGELLAQRRVPFSEVIASLHLYEEAAISVFPDASTLSMEIYRTFDKLSHIRVILLADAYFRSEFAIAGARIQALEREASRLPNAERSTFHGLVSASSVMRRLYERIEAAGRTRGTVLIVGESGTGKELVAHAIHECGGKEGRPFVALNCAAIPKDLIESELFGYKRGAFSGANADYLGLFRAANGGTLFLDEVTEMSAETQSKFLRAIQERLVRPVGSTQEIAVDVRLIASTNRDPQEAVRAGSLRQDLYYRLQASVLNVPRLREHPEDIPALVDHFIALFNEKLRPEMPLRAIEESALEAMKSYPWPGNVRELSNAVEGAFTFSRSPVIRLQDLPSAVTGSRADDPQPTSDGNLGSFADAERDIIQRTLETTNGNKLAASKLLRISRKKLYAKIAKYGL